MELLPHFMAKARQDEVRGIIITPTSVTGAHWNRLLQASLPSDGKPYIAVTHPMNLLRHSAAFFTAELAIFLWTLESVGSILGLWLILVRLLILIECAPVLHGYRRTQLLHGLVTSLNLDTNQLLSQPTALELSDGTGSQ